MANKRKDIILYIVLSLLLAFSFVASLCIGRYNVPVNEVFNSLFSKSNSISAKVVQNLRLPRTLIAIFIGASLAVSGAIYQSAFNNKLVSPDLLGVSSGASVGACLGILLGFSTMLISVFAFVLGFAAVMLALIIAKAFKNKSNIILVLAGLAVGGLMSSLVGLMKYLADSELKLAEMTYWLLGDISGTNMNDVWVMLPITIVCCVLAIILSRNLNVITLGEKESKSLGVNYKLCLYSLIAIATLLTAVSVSIGGSIGWTGLVVPNIVRLFVGSNNKKVIPVSMLVGSIAMVIVDTLARSIAPNEIPLSVITGIIGTPVFVFAIFKGRRQIQ